MPRISTRHDLQGIDIVDPVLAAAFCEGVREGGFQLVIVDVTRAIAPKLRER